MNTTIIKIVILFLIYYFSGSIGLTLQSINGHATYLWAPTGISIAALLIAGYKIWPAVAVGAFLVNYHVGAPVWIAAGIAVGNTLEALLGAFILKSDPTFSLPLTRFKDVTRFIFLVIPLSAFISATVGIFSLTFLTGSSVKFQMETTWTTWWIGNVMGALVITPLALSWVKSSWSWKGLRASRAIECVILGLSVFLVSAKIFFSNPHFSNPTHTLIFAVFPFIIWAAVRFSMQGVVVTTFIISVTTITGTVLGRGPFGAIQLSQSLYYVETFMAIAACTGLLLASALYDREKTKETLQTNKALQAFLDNMSTFCAKVGVDGRIILLNQAAFKDSGLKLEEISQTHFLNGNWWNLNGSEKEKIKNAFQLASQGEANSVELDILTAQHGKTPMGFTLTPVLLPTGKVDYVVVEGKDLSREKAAQSLLRKSESMLAYAQRVAHLGSWEWDIEKDQLMFSNELFRIHGIQPSQFSHSLSGYLKLVHPEDRDHFIKVIENSKKKGEPFQVEKRIIKPDGIICNLETKGIVIKDEKGKILKMVGSCQDITDFKKAEVERNSLLERERKARQEAEASIRAKDLFLATLSHELRTPLTTILSWAQILQSRTLDPEKTRRGYLMIEQSARAQQQMIEDLLDISRIIMNKAAIQMKPVDPCGIVLDAIESVRLQAEEKQIRLTTYFENCKGLVSADAGRLKQVIWNLLANALRFTPDGGEIRIKAETIQRESQEKEWVRISIKDNGKGLTSEFLPKVFDSFTQADSSSTRKHGGLGIGLAIVKKLTEMHQGKVSVYSEGLGKGAEFSVELPLLTYDVKTHSSNSHPGVKSTMHLENHDLLSLKGIRILLIDDDQAANEAVTESLRALGGQITTAYSSREGLAKLDQMQIDIVVCDIAMPEEDGYSFIQKVRNLPSTQLAHLPVIALSAFAYPEDKKRSLDSGFSMHISKPVERSTLERAILQLVQSRQLRHTDRSLSKIKNAA